MITSVSRATSAAGISTEISRLCLSLFFVSAVSVGLTLCLSLYGAKSRCFLKFRNGTEFMRPLTLSVKRRESSVKRRKWTFVFESTVSYPFPEFRRGVPEVDLYRRDHVVFKSVGSVTSGGSDSR